MAPHRRHLPCRGGCRKAHLSPLGHPASFMKSVQTGLSPADPSFFPFPAPFLSFAWPLPGDRTHCWICCMMSLSSLSPLLIILLRAGCELNLQHPHRLQKSLVRAIVLHLSCSKNLHDLSCKSVIGVDQG